MLIDASALAASSMAELPTFSSTACTVGNFYPYSITIPADSASIGSIPTALKPKEPKKPAKLLPDILKIAHPNNTTVVHWADDTTTSVRLMPGETYDKYAAFCACVVKKIYGNTSRAKKICDRYDYEAMQAKEREKREKEEEKLRAKAKRRLKERIKRRARELYIEEEARKLAAANALKADK